MNLGRPHCRSIAAIVMFFMLALQLVNAHSTSHLQLEHGHPVATAHGSAAESGHHHDHDDAAPDDGAKKHTHKHNPGDHTHDLPLRLFRAAIEFAFMPDWHPAAPLAMYSNILDPLERPPKRPSPA